MSKQKMITKASFTAKTIKPTRKNKQEPTRLVILQDIFDYFQDVTQ